MKRPYVVHFKKGKRKAEFHTVAKSDNDALRIFRKFHKGKHVEAITVGAGI